MRPTPALAGLLTAALLVLVPAGASAETTDVSVTLTDGQLAVLGTSAADVVRIRSGAGPSVEVLVGEDRVPPFRFRGAEVTSLAVDLGAGADVLTLTDEHGSLLGHIPATLVPGDGHDVVQVVQPPAPSQPRPRPRPAPVTVDLDSPGSSPHDSAVDEVVLTGSAAADWITVSGTSAKTVVGGPSALVTIVGAFQPFDRLVVDGGPGSDDLVLPAPSSPSLDTTLRGGAGVDTLSAHGTEAGNGMTVVAEAGSLFVHTQVDYYAVDAERVRVLGQGGKDSLRVTGVVLGTALTLEGGPGDDLLTGGDGVETLLGGEGTDQLVGQGGADRIEPGPGLDNVSWSAGHGNDLVDGQDGEDFVRLMGTPSADDVEISTRGRQAHIRVGGETVAVSQVENLSISALDGPDRLVVADLAGVGVGRVDLYLRPGFQGLEGDGQPDEVRLLGTDAAEAFRVQGAPGVVTVDGGAVPLVVFAADHPLDLLVLDTRGGDDTVDTQQLQPGSIELAVIP